MMKLKSVYFVYLIAGVSACGRQLSQTAEVPAFGVSSKQLVDFLAAVPQAAVVENYRVISAMTFATFFDTVVVPHARQNYEIDSQIFVGRVAALETQRTAFLDAAQSFQTMGAYFRATGTNVNSVVGAASIEAALQTTLAGSQRSALGLADKAGKNPEYGYPDYGPNHVGDCDQRVDALFEPGGTLAGTNLHQLEYILNYTAQGAAVDGWSGLTFNQGYSQIDALSKGPPVAHAIDFYLWRLATPYGPVDPKMPPDPTLNQCFSNRTPMPIFPMDKAATS